MDEPMTVEETSLTPSPSNNYTDKEHKQQDQTVTLDISEHFTEERELSDGDCAILLESIAEHSEGKLEFIGGQKPIKLVRDKPKLKSALQKAWKTKDYKAIRESGEFRALPPPMDEPMTMEETSLTPSSSKNFIDKKHKELDEKVTLALKFLHKEQQLSDGSCAILLNYIANLSEGRLELISIPKAIELMSKKPKLKSALQKAWKTKNYKEIRESELLTKPKPDKYEPVEQKKATENAWAARYRGEAPVALWARIQRDMEQQNRYARYLAIVQSSGTGKSRMIEELSKTHLVIPVNLRGSYETGYPPPDKTARAYLSGTASQQEARVHAVAFLRAVFQVASKLITDLRKEGKDSHEQIVGSFRKYMSDGMGWDSHGAKRLSFYDKVDSGARGLEVGIKQTFDTLNESSLDNQLASVGLCEAFKKLITTLFPTSSCRPEADSEPFVILAFDEARTLVNPYNNEPWSHFTELRRVLRVLNHEPLFSLFLTTTGNVNALVTSSGKDYSSRIQSQLLSTSRPFAEVGFDHFAFKDQFDLQVVAGDEHISHFGRPLWATRYEEGDYSVKSGIIQFAAGKLRAGKAYPGDTLDVTEKMACLAQRLPIEFHSVTYASKSKELELVEGHMRILLRLDAGFESLITVSASEPLLSEAAYWMMMSPDTPFKAAETLKNCLDGYAIHKGDRGELLAMLLFILARDRAIGHPNDYGQPKSGRRWCFVPDFMSALFTSTNASLKTLFAESKIFFNHWVKVHQYAMVNVKYLAQLMRRGAALLCATNHTGIDGIIPFLLAGYTISLNSIGVILFQVKNDSKYTHKPRPKLFKAMHPYALGILGPRESRDKIPIIRIFFALASKTPCLKRVPCKQDDDFKFCDFWVGGISPTVFSPVDRNDESIWTALLQATYGWEDLYKTKDKGNAARTEEDLRRSMNPGTAENEHHWENWADFAAMGNIEEDEDEDEDEDEEDENEEEDESMDVE